MVMIPAILRNARARSQLLEAGVIAQLNERQVIAITTQALRAEEERARLGKLLQECGLDPAKDYHISPEGLVTPR